MKKETIAFLEKLIDVNQKNIDKGYTAPKDIDIVKAKIEKLKYCLLAVSLMPENIKCPCDECCFRGLSCKGCKKYKEYEKYRNANYEEHLKEKIFNTYRYDESAKHIKKNKLY